MKTYHRMLLFPALLVTGLWSGLGGNDALAAKKRAPTHKRATRSKAHASKAKLKSTRNEALLKEAMANNKLIGEIIERLSVREAEGLSEKLVELCEQQLFVAKEGLQAANGNQSPERVLLMSRRVLVEARYLEQRYK